VVQVKPPNLKKLPFVVSQENLKQWQPYFPDASVIQQGYVQGDNGQNIDLFIASYNSGKGELISSLNKLYVAERWTLVHNKTIQLATSKYHVYLTMLTSPLGSSRYIIHWYKIGEQKFTSKIKAKLYQTSRLFLGRSDNNALIAFSIQFIGDDRIAIDDLRHFIDSNLEVIDKALLSNGDA
jgi:EpsI family protein